jgi:hypothetical protein
MKKCYFILVFLFSTTLYGQVINIKADNFYHIFEGAGVSIGLYMGHHWSMNEPNRDKAIQLINKDCNMRYLQDYCDRYPADDPAYYDRRADYIKAAKVYQPNMKISMVGNKFPRVLMHDSLIGGVLKPILNTDDPLIYDKVADWFFQLFKGFKDRGVEVDILNVVNEPDFDKKFYYGQGGNTEQAVALIFTRSVVKFKEMLNNPTINTSNMRVPLIMGPSTLDPGRCVYYIKYFKQNYPEAWRQIDIVATHQYTNGTNETMLNGIQAEAGVKPYFQSEMHTNRGDNLGTLPINEEHRGILSLANVFGPAIRSGVSAWFYFENNYPNVYTPAGLLYVSWQSTNPVPYRHYYAFKQLTSAQPAFSNVVENTVSGFPNSDVLIFRKGNEDTLYAHVSNFSGQTRPVTLNFAGSSGNIYKVKSYTVRVTDGVLNDETSAPISFQVPPSGFMHAVNPYSVNTFKIVLKKEGTSATTQTNENTAFQFLQSAEKVYISSHNNQRIKSVTVHNIMGRVVANQSNTAPETAQVNVENWASGLYFFTIETDKMRVVKKFFVH